jgi:hypothetical protein
MLPPPYTKSIFLDTFSQETKKKEEIIFKLEQRGRDQLFAYFWKLEGVKKLVQFGILDPCQSIFFQYTYMGITISVLLRLELHGY